MTAPMLMTGSEISVLTACHSQRIETTETRCLLSLLEMSLAYDVRSNVVQLDLSRKLYLMQQINAETRKRNMWTECVVMIGFSGYVELQVD